jgi:hypothetical protein
MRGPWKPLLGMLAALVARRQTELGAPPPEPVPLED